MSNIILYSFHTPRLLYFKLENKLMAALLRKIIIGLFMYFSLSQTMSLPISSNKPTLVNVPELVSPMIQTHRSGINRTYQWRIQQLDNFKRMIQDNQKEFQEALYQDLHKDPIESLYCEVYQVINEIDYIKKHLKKWMKPKKVASVAALSPSFSEIRFVPLCEPAVLIIVPFNYPLFLSGIPAVGALAAGSPCVLKLNPDNEAMTRLYEKLIPEYFDESCLRFVSGGVENTTELLKHPWGLCLFTGSGRVGKLVQEATAKTLTPTILELGGKSPLIITENCPSDMVTVCNRIVSIKLLNSGQTCVVPDYALCHKSKVEEFCKEFESALHRQFTSNPKESSMARIISSSYAQRLLDMITEIESVNKDAILIGGAKYCDVKEKYIAPTLILNPPMTSRVMKEEIFGPILPVITYDSDEEAISIINGIEGTPLAMYVFCKSKAIFENYASRCQAAAILRNDLQIQLTNKELPFGGLGSSGYGRYRGKYSFEAFSHKQPCIYHPCYSIFDFFGLRYHPHKGVRGELVPIAIRYLPDILSMRKHLLRLGALAISCSIGFVIGVLSQMK